MHRIIESKLKIKYKDNEVKKRHPKLILLGQRLRIFFNHYTLLELKPNSLLGMA